jgi:molybdopterin-guanine dinucleotide biosynthesis protein A
MNEVSAVILAGGRSTRFGADKAGALLRREPLLEWVSRAVASAVAEVVVVRAPGQALPSVREAVRIVDDEVAGQGPLAGMVSGLAAVRTSLAFVVSCDAPLLEPGLVPLLADMSSGFDVVLPVARGRTQPLCALYCVEPSLPALRAALARRELKVHAAIAGLRIREVEEAMLRTVDAELRSFRNCNTREDLAELEMLLRSEPRD